MYTNKGDKNYTTRSVPPPNNRANARNSFSVCSNRRRQIGRVWKTRSPGLNGVHQLRKFSLTTGIEYKIRQSYEEKVGTQL